MYSANTYRFNPEETSQIQWLSFPYCGCCSTDAGTDRQVSRQDQCLQMTSGIAWVYKCRHQPVGGTSLCKNVNSRKKIGEAHIDDIVGIFYGILLFANVDVEVERFGIAGDLVDVILFVKLNWILFFSNSGCGAIHQGGAVRLSSAISQFIRLTNPCLATPPSHGIMLTSSNSRRKYVDCE